MDPAPLRVLCVDDNRDAADSEAMLLELHGCEVEACYDGASALAAALRFGPDACLIDLNMPGMDGCELARQLRAWRRAQPVFLIAVTAYGSDAAREMTAAAGFDMHVVKPADWARLSSALARLERALGRAERIGRSQLVALGAGRDRAAHATG
jgi:two-component system OmpR family response regulator